MTATRQRRFTRWSLAIGVTGCLLFCLLATLNSGGYQYGVSDQAFYLPAVLMDLQPDLFSHDRGLLAAQDRVMIFDEMLAGISRAFGLSLPVIFFGGYLAGLALLWTSVTLLGRTMYASWVTVAAFDLALTLRHRIAKTGVNTLEGYLHPRMLAFGLGVAGLVAFLRGRTWLALAIALATAALHPTIALFFCAWIGIAAIAADPSARLPVTTGLAVAVLVGIWVLWRGPLRGGFGEMDAAWIAALASKDYVFPHEWPASAWVLNLGYALLMLAIYRVRTRRGIASIPEGGLVIGALALAGLFLASLPFIAMHVAIAVQLQVSRVFWMLDLFATVYLIWFLSESGVWTRWGVSPVTARIVLVAVLAAFSVGRGVYILRVEHPGRPVVALDVPPSPWQRAMAWADQATPIDSNFLADPGHAWRLGTSVRIAGRRDVFLEEVKDSAMAMYSREVALRVVDRTRALGDFNHLTPDAARALARRYDLDYLIIDRPLDLPVAHREGNLIVYSLAPPGS